MRSKDLAREIPIDFQISQLSKKSKIDTSFYSRLMPKQAAQKQKEIIEILDDDDDIDSLLQDLNKLTVQEPASFDRDEYKPEILNFKKDILDILLETQLNDTSFEDRFQSTEICKPNEAVKPLSDQENAIVDRLFKKGQNGQVAQLRNAVVSFKDIYRLYPETWLNDEIVNFYFELLSERANSTEGMPSIHCYNTFFCSTLRDQGYAKVRRWTKRVDVFSKDLLFVPINQSYHWVLGVMDMKNKTVAVYDSLGGNHDRTLSLFLTYLEQEHLDKKKTPLDTSGWKKLTPKDIPRQGNMSDCGAFTCTFADRLSQQRPFDFSQDDMVVIRRRMALSIFNKAI